MTTSATIRDTIDLGDLRAEVDRALAPGGVGLTALLKRYDASEATGAIALFVLDCILMANGEGAQGGDA